VLYKTQGIIIKRTNSGEFDRLLTIYTKNFGKILVRAKAIRKNQSKLKGHLELFLHSHLLLAPGKNLDIITGAEAIEKFSELHQRLPCLATAYYLSEIIDKTIAGPEKDAHIWQLILSSFQKLNQEKPNIKTIISDFEKKLLEFLGYGENQQTASSFISSLLGEKIHSRDFLSICLNL
jgi:DNA repair protein RecO (recombination protein O)